MGDLTINNGVVMGFYHQTLHGCNSQGRDLYVCPTSTNLQEAEDAVISVYFMEEILMRSLWARIIVSQKARLVLYG